MFESNDPAEVPESPESPGAGADPMAMLAFLQRLVATMSSGGNVDALMATAPPGFRELFADAERRVQAGETPDLGALFGMFGAGDEDEGDDEGDDPAPAEGRE